MCVSVSNKKWVVVQLAQVGSSIYDMWSSLPPGNYSVSFVSSTTKHVTVCRVRQSLSNPLPLPRISIRRVRAEMGTHPNHVSDRGVAQDFPFTAAAPIYAKHINVYSRKAFSNCNCPHPSACANSLPNIWRLWSGWYGLGPRSKSPWQR